MSKMLLKLDASNDKAAGDQSVVVSKDTAETLFIKLLPGVISSLSLKEFQTKKQERKPYWQSDIRYLLPKEDHKLFAKGIATLCFHCENTGHKKDAHAILTWLEAEASTANLVSSRHWFSH